MKSFHLEKFQFEILLIYGHCNRRFRRIPIYSPESHPALESS